MRTVHISKEPPDADAAAASEAVRAYFLSDRFRSLVAWDELTERRRTVRALHAAEQLAAYFDSDAYRAGGYGHAANVAATVGRSNSNTAQDSAA